VKAWKASEDEDERGARWDVGLGGYEDEDDWEESSGRP
jgi:hypothetical protein